VKNSSLTTKDVKNGSLLKVDFKRGQLPRGAQGPTGDTGPQRQPGAKGDTGATVTGKDVFNPSEFTMAWLGPLS
jgi:hypothetical protein